MPLGQAASTFRGGLLVCGPPFEAWRRRTCDEGPHQGMSAVPTDISLTSEPGGPGRESGLPRNAQIYFAAVAITAAGVTLPFIGRLQTTHQWPAFLILASAAAIARLFVVRTPADQAYHTDIVFLIPAALILPPELLVLVAVVQMVPEWLKMRYR